MGRKPLETGTGGSAAPHVMQARSLSKMNVTCLSDRQCKTHQIHASVLELRIQDPISASPEVPAISSLALLQFPPSAWDLW